MELKRTYKLFEKTALREYQVRGVYALKLDQNWVGFKVSIMVFKSKCNLKDVRHDL